MHLYIRHKYGLVCTVELIIRPPQVGLLEKCAGPTAYKYWGLDNNVYNIISGVGVLFYLKFKEPMCVKMSIVVSIFLNVP